MAFSLNNIFQSVSSALGQSQNASVIGIDIGASSVKIVQLRASRGMAVLETYGEIALAPYSKLSVGKAVKLPAEKTAEAIVDLMREANVTSRAGGLAIPFASSLVSVLDLPKVDDDALKRMVPIEARKYIPIPVSEVTLDWFIIPEEKGSDSAFDKVAAQVGGPGTQPIKGREVLLVAIHNELLRNYKTITTNTGITAQFYEIEIFSVIRSTLGHGLTPVLIVDFGASSTKIYVVERGIVRLTHLVSIGGQHMTETLERSMGWEFDKSERIKREHGLVPSTAFSSEENEKIKAALLSTLSRIFAEVNRVLLSYGQRYNKSVTKVVLVGGGASLAGLMDVARSSLNAEVEIGNPFTRTEAPAFLQTVLQTIGPGFAGAVGVALRKLKNE